MMNMFAAFAIVAILSLSSVAPMNEDSARIIVYMNSVRNCVLSIVGADDPRFRIPGIFAVVPDEYADWLDGCQDDEGRNALFYLADRMHAFCGKRTTCNLAQCSNYYYSKYSMVLHQLYYGEAYHCPTKPFERIDYGPETLPDGTIGAAHEEMETSE